MNSINWIGLTKRLPVIALLIIAAWLLVRIGLSAWSGARSGSTLPTPSAVVAGARNVAAEAPGSRLFGTPARLRSIPDEPTFLTDGNFRLRGVVASSRQGMAHAIIESGGASKAYFPGDTVAAGISLQAVKPNEVLLHRGGEVMRLPLSGISDSANRASARNVGLGSANTTGIGDNLLAPPRMSLSQLINTEPIMDAGGKLEGYRISPRARREWFESQGLVSGDLIIAVNGVPFDANDVAQARQEMSSGGDMTLSILRDGEQLEITIGSASFGLLAM